MPPIYFVTDKFVLFYCPGHYLGMDVHDCSIVGYDRPLKPGVVSCLPYFKLWDVLHSIFRDIGDRMQVHILHTEPLKLSFFIVCLYPIVCTQTLAKCLHCMSDSLYALILIFRF